MMRSILTSHCQGFGGLSFGLSLSLGLSLVLGSSTYALAENSDILAQSSDVLPLPAIAGPTPPQTIAPPAPVFKGRIPVPGRGVFLMPTKDCRYTRLTNNEIVLETGGIMVKTTTGSVIVSANAGEQKVMTVVDKNSLALVSTFDNNVSVTTFIADKHKSIALILPPKKDGKPHELHVPIGTEADVFSKENQALPFNILMATNHRVARDQLPSGARVHTYPIDYPRTLRYYGMSQSLPAKDYQRLLHIAACVMMATHRY